MIGLKFCEQIFAFFAFFNLVYGRKGDASVVELPIVFYSYGQLAALTSQIDWATLIQCPQSTANNPYLQISIIQPENPFFLNTKAFTVMEVSSCPNSFASQCIIAVNYIKTGGSIQGYSSVVIPYNSSIDTLSIRFRAEVGVSPVAIHVGYVDGNPFNGVYDFSVFGTVNPPNNSPHTFGQYVKLAHSDTVPNEQYKYYFSSFCQDDIKMNGNNPNYYVNVMVTSDPSTPLAAFDVVACSDAAIPDLSYCTILNSNYPGVIIDDDAASVVSIQMDSGKIDLSEGFYVGVYGYGGETSFNNSFLLAIQETPYSS